MPSDVDSPSCLRYVQSFLLQLSVTHIVLVSLSLGKYNVDVDSPSRLSLSFITWPPHRPIIHTPTSTYIPLDVDYTPIATHLCMVACADLPHDLKYAVWAESKEWASSQWPLSVVEGPISSMMV